MQKISATSPGNSHHSLRALCALSAPHGRLNPDKLSELIHESPDPASALNRVFQELPTHSSEALGRKWRQVILDLWSKQHPHHLPHLLDLPIASHEVMDAPAIQDALTILRLLEHRPADMILEGSEWLLHPADAYHFASNLPSRSNRPLIQLESEWQSLTLRRLRANLQVLRLVRRLNGRLVIVQSRYQRFKELPPIQQYYLLWHTDVYHTNWAMFASLWADHLHVVQACVPLVWDLAAGALPGVSYDIRRWNQDMWDTFAPLWEHEGLLERRRHDSVLFSYVRTQSVPTAVTQVVLRDLLERYGLIITAGPRYMWTELGFELISAERQRELPCALDLMK